MPQIRLMRFITAGVAAVLGEPRKKPNPQQ
jgi:hypothetical protein